MIVLSIGGSLPSLGSQSSEHVPGRHAMWPGIIWALEALEALERQDSPARPDLILRYRLPAQLKSRGRRSECKVQVGLDV